MYKIYLDPGHGGIDPGAEGNGKQESVLALQVAKKVAALLPTKYFTVKMSRTEQATPGGLSPSADLSRRAQDANSWGADVYVSIHLNSGGGHGVETWRSIYGGKGQTLAQDMQAAVLQACTGYADRGLKSRQGSHGDYLAVIRESDMPAVLVECGFIDSADDMRAWSADKFAAGITAGIRKYFNVATYTPAAKPTLRYAPAGATSSSDTTMDVTRNVGGAYTVKITCAAGCPNVTTGDGSIVDITRVSYAGSDYFFRLTAKQRGAAGIFVGGKKIFVFKAV